MRTTVTLDDEWLAKASAATGISKRYVLLHEGLKLIVQRVAAKRLAAIRNRRKCSRPAAGTTPSLCACAPRQVMPC